MDTANEEAPMATKADFTQEEWATVRDTPYLAAMAVTVAGASGILGTLKEAFSATSSLVEGMRSQSDLIRSLSAREEIQAAQETVRSLVQPGPGADLAALKTKLESLVTERVRAAVVVLSKKGNSQDVAAYRDFVKGVGDRVSQAAKEGGFLGFGGERVSEGEKTMLAALDRALTTA
jgi:hypothetical protein